MLALVGTASAENPHPAAGGLAGHAFDGKQHVFYRDGADRLCQLFWNGTRWSFEDLSSSPTVRAPPISGTPSVVTLGTSLHVFYRTKFNKIAELYRTVTPAAATNPGPFKHNDLTKLAGVEAGVATDPVAWVFGNSLHVAYVGTDGVLHELYWSGSDWRHAKIAVSGNPSFHILRTKPAATTFGGDQYVFWLQGDVDPTTAAELWATKWQSSTNKWQQPQALIWRTAVKSREQAIGDDFGRTDVDIVGFTGVAASSDSKGVALVVGVKRKNESSTWWIGPQGTLADFTRWYRVDRDDLPGSPTIVPWKSKFPGPYTKDGKIILAESGSMVATPTLDAGVTVPPKSRPTLWTLGDSLHVAYPTADGHIHELTLDTSWRHRDLTQLASGGN